MKTTDEIADLTWNNLKPKMLSSIIDSEGARAERTAQTASAMRGLILDPTGKIVELPIKSNFREGLTIFEYVASARGSRKGLTDSALKTANAGYLTRRLVDVSHDVIISKDDCGVTEGIVVEAHEKDREAELITRITGRFTAAKVVSKKTRKQLLSENEEITEEKAKLLVKTM
jgi:DNA-directed RNA polymerase subunit beta'